MDWYHSDFLSFPWDAVGNNLRIYGRQFKTLALVRKAVCMNPHDSDDKAIGSLRELRALKTLMITRHNILEWIHGEQLENILPTGLETLEIEGCPRCTGNIRADAIRKLITYGSLSRTRVIRIKDESIYLSPRRSMRIWAGRSRRAHGQRYSKRCNERRVSDGRIEQNWGNGRRVSCVIKW